MRGLTNVRQVPARVGSLRLVGSAIRLVPVGPLGVVECGPVGDKLGDESWEPNALAEPDLNRCQGTRSGGRARWSSDPGGGGGVMLPRFTEPRERLANGAAATEPRLTM